MSFKPGHLGASDKIYHSTRSLNIGRGFRYQVAKMSSIHNRGPSGRQKQELPDWQETTHFGVTRILEVKKGGRRWESPASEYNILLITPSLQ